MGRLFLFYFNKPLLAGEEFESELMRQLRLGAFHILLPETQEQLYATIGALSMKKLRLRRLLISEYLKLRLSMLDQHKKSKKINCYKFSKFISISTIKFLNQPSKMIIQIFINLMQD
jgi:hypothetical protein